MAHHQDLVVDPRRHHPPAVDSTPLTKQDYAPHDAAVMVLEEVDHQCVAVAAAAEAAAQLAHLAQVVRADPPPPCHRLKIKVLLQRRRRRPQDHHKYGEQRVALVQASPHHDLH